MNAPVSLSVMFQEVGLSYGWSMPVLLLVGIGILTIAVSHDGGKPSERLRALYCHLIEFIGVLLMTAGALPALYAVFSKQPLTQITYVGLMMVFAVGGLLFLWHDARRHEVPVAARETADAIFLNLWKLTGMLVIIFTVLSFLLKTMLIMDKTNGWWIIHLTMLLYGLVLCWFTIHRRKVAPPAPAKRVLFAKKAPARKK